MQVEVQGDALRVVPDTGYHGKPLAELLQHGLHLPIGFCRQVIAAGRVRIGKQAAVGLQDTIPAGHPLWLFGGIWPDEAVSDAPCDVNPATVLLEDEHLLIVNKPADMLVHSDGKASMPTLDDSVRLYRLLSGQPAVAWHVHRLDMGTTGTVLYAKHAWMARALDQMLAQRQITRTYLAIVVGRPRTATGTFTHPIGRHRHVAGKYIVSKTGKPAVTHYKVLAEGHVNARQISLLQCWLDTGRTHQIRVHLSHIGCPIIGDVLYGGGEGAGSIRLHEGFALHAWQLSLQHPYTDEIITVTAELPETFTSLFEGFGDSFSINRRLNGAR